MKHRWFAWFVVSLTAAIGLGEIGGWHWYKSVSIRSRVMAKATRPAVTAWTSTTPQQPAATANQTGTPRKRRLLAIGDAQTYGYQHDSVSHALATIERIGREQRLYDTWIRTDTQLLTKQPVMTASGPGRNIKNLRDFDAVFFYTAGNPVLSAQQQADLLSFIKEDGKGFLGGHSATTTFYQWSAFGEMMGGYFDDHPWGVFDARLIVEDPHFPAMKHFPAHFTIRDEIYQLKAPYARDKVRVLLRLDVSQVNLQHPRVHRTDKDFPVAWASQYGKGRVFNCSLGHPDETWDRPDIQQMWLEAIKWALGLTEADVTPRPLPAATATDASTTKR